MAIEGKKINELTQISDVSNETVLPAVYVSGNVTQSIANKISVQQISTKIQGDLAPALAAKQDLLPEGTEGYFLKKTADGVEWAQTASGTTDVNTISETSGTIALETNKVYKVALSGNTTFTLPTTVDNTKFNQIYVQIDVTGDITVDFGTTNYFTVEPVLNEGPAWINYEYNANENAWYVGQIGVVASSGANTDLSNLTDLGKSQVANLAMPSDVTEDLTVVSGTIYTAPADGYVGISLGSGNCLQIILLSSNAPSDALQYRLMELVIGPSNNYPRGFIPISKGQKFCVDFLNGTMSYAHFVYAKGSETEYQGE